jgi:Phasin protein
MTDSAQPPPSGDTQVSSQPDLAEVQQRSADALARANEVLAAAAQALRQSQIELSRLESAQAAKLLERPKFGEDPNTVISARYDRWRDGSEQLIAHMRTINDLAHECGWQLFQICADNLRQNAKSTQLTSL